MKKFINYIPFLFAAMVMGSCGDDFLNSEPITKKTDLTYYTLPKEAEEALVGCYDALQYIWDDGVALPIASEIMSDLCFAGTGSGDGDGYVVLDEFDKNVSPSDLSMFEKNWEYYYKGVYRCNVLISKIDQIDWTNAEEQHNTILAEVRFLRAFFYFDMVRMWGHIPLLTEPSNDNLDQANPDDVYGVIVDDLLYAIENGDDKPFASISQSTYGHANKWAAEALMARVFLYYTGYYSSKSELTGTSGSKVTKADALAYLEDIILNGGFGLVENYSELWPAAAQYFAVKNGKKLTDAVYAGETNKEIVFSVKYTYTSDYNGNTDGNHWLVMNGPRTSTIAKYGYYYGWGACTVIPSFYSEWNTKFPKDTRRESSIMAIQEEGITGYNSKDEKEYTGYYTKKYVPLCDAGGNPLVGSLGIASFMISQYQDYFSIRYADVLLIAAELGSSNALDYFNLVHERAGNDPITSIDKDAIFEERKYEFAFEGLRYWDLLRYGNGDLAYAAEKISFNSDNVNWTITNANIKKTKVISAANFLGTRGLFQIPNDQITLSGNKLQQNDGWK